MVETNIPAHIVDAAHEHAKTMLMDHIRACWTHGIKVWDRGNCEWDSSGLLIDLYVPYDDEELLEHLEVVNDVLKDYTGASRATYCSGLGLEYLTWDCEWSDEVESLMHEAVREEMGDDAHDRLHDDIVAMSLDLCCDAEYEGAQDLFDSLRDAAAARVAEARDKDKERLSSLVHLMLTSYNTEPEDHPVGDPEVQEIKGLVSSLPPAVVAEVTLPHVEATENEESYNWRQEVHWLSNLVCGDGDYLRTHWEDIESPEEVCHE